jgi:DME family drug/metabolite transporter
MVHVLEPLPTVRGDSLRIEGTRRSFREAQVRESRGFGPTSAILAATLWGTIGTAASLVPNGTDPLAIAAARAVLGGTVLMFIAARPTAVRLVLSSARAFLWLGLAGAAMALNQLTYFAAIEDAGPALTSVVTMSSIPVFSGLIARLSGSRLSRRWAITTAGAITGCTLLVINGMRLGEHVVSGIGYSLLAGAALAWFSTLVARLIAGGGDSTTTMALVFAVAGLLMSPILLAGPTQWLFTPAGAGVTLYLALAATVGAYRLYGHALRTVSVPMASTLILAEPAVATLLSVTVLGQHLDALSCAGLTLIGATLLAAALPQRPPRRTTPPRHRIPSQRLAYASDQRVQWRRRLQES